MSAVTLIRSVPVLPVNDVPKAVAFYRDNLGFAQAFEQGTYAGVQRGPIELHLNGYVQSVVPIICRVDVRGVDALYGEIEPKGIVDPQEPINTKPWGMRQFTVIDLCGNRITFAENLNAKA